MAYHWYHAFAVGPLAWYLFLLGVWHGSTHPRVVSGAADSASLAVGIGGVVLFGPFGQMFGILVFGKPTFLSWLIMTSGWALLAVAGAWSAGRRLLVYHIDRGTLEGVLEEMLEPVGFTRTLQGFEDPPSCRGVSIEHSEWSKTATIQAFGREPERLTQSLQADLVLRLKSVESHPTRIAGMFMALSALTLGIPMVCWILAEPWVRDAARMLFERVTAS